MASFALPRDFRAVGITCGIKASGKPDLALFVSDRPAVAAGVFTTNRVVGAPVIVSRERVPADSVRAVVVNSGNSNACTGQQGLVNARRMTAEVATAINARPEEVLVCSTGVIGVHLPIDVISRGIPKAAAELKDSADGFHSAAVAMMTTDTVSKQASIDVELSTGIVRIAGCAKGAAMIAPNMATMLCVVMTDVVLDSAACDKLLKFAVDRTFNCISVDGHMSTSDTVLLLANGASGAAPQTDNDAQLLQNALKQVCEKLATDIIRDAEGAEHFVIVDVDGFESRDIAVRIAREICESALVKTAITGNDPNWGRITSAAGYAGIPFDVSCLSLTINDTKVFEAGTPVDFSDAELSQQMKQNREVRLLLKLSGGPHSGTASVRFWTSDLTQEYVRLNSDYKT